MEITITARCVYCVTVFRPRFVSGIYEIDDFTGRACCPECYCPECGHGHLHAAEFADCAQRNAPGDAWINEIDPDVMRDHLREALLEHAALVPA